jgi:hypothetical protein
MRTQIADATAANRPSDFLHAWPCLVRIGYSTSALAARTHRRRDRSSALNLADATSSSASARGCRRCSRWHGDELLAPDAECRWIPLRRRRQPRLPQRFPGLDVERAERAIEVADEPDTSRRGDDSGQERATLLKTPDGRMVLVS